MVFNTQNLEPWLRWFLSRKSINDHLETTFNKPRGTTDGDPVMRDVQDSPRWRELQSSMRSKYHLMFGLYIDWFNPLSNKLAGEFSRM
jgi:hypothetical protein